MRVVGISSLLLIVAIVSASDLSRAQGRAMRGGGGGAPIGVGKPPGEVQAIADAELAFARTAEQKGIRDAFVEHLGPDAILLRPGPVNGRDFMSKRPGDTGPLLAWEPSYVELSASGELGWDTGPWSFKPDRAKDAVAWGHFATVWQRDESGRWWAIMDHGHDMPAAGGPEPLVWARSSLDPNLPGGPVLLSDEAAKAASSDLAAADAAYGEALARGGLKAALMRYAAPDVRVYREGKSPVRGAPAQTAFPNEWKGGVVGVKSNLGVISKAGDLGYTYGTIALADTSVSKHGRNFMRVWRRNGPEGWRIALDIVNEIPKP